MSLNKLIKNYVSLDQQIKNEKSKLKKWSLTRKRDGLKNKYIKEYAKSGAETRDEAKKTFERRKKRLICSITCNCDEDACTKRENINNCHWIPELTKKNPYDAEKTIKTPAKCEKIKKTDDESLFAGQYFKPTDKLGTPRQLRNPQRIIDFSLDEDQQHTLKLEHNKKLKKAMALQKAYDDKKRSCR